MFHNDFHSYQINNNRNNFKLYHSNIYCINIFFFQCQNMNIIFFFFLIWIKIHKKLVLNFPLTFIKANKNAQLVLSICFFLWFSICSSEKYQQQFSCCIKNFPGLKNKKKNSFDIQPLLIIHYSFTHIIQKKIMSN